MWKESHLVQFEKLAKEIGFNKTCCYLSINKDKYYQLIIFDHNEDPLFPTVFRDYLIDKQYEPDNLGITKSGKQLGIQIPIPVYEAVYSTDPKIIDFLERHKDSIITNNNATKQNAKKYKFGEQVVPYQISLKKKPEGDYYFISSWRLPGSGMFLLTKVNPNGTIKLVKPTNIRRFSEVEWVENE